VKALIGSLIVALLALGCVAGRPGSPTNPPSSAPTTAVPSRSTPAVTPAASPTEPHSPLPSPPDAFLQAGDGDPVEGRLGSGCYLDACADSPWLPAAGLPVLEPAGGDEELTVSIAPGFEFVRWTARYAAADDPSGERARPLAEGGADDGPAVAEASFRTPPSGDWVVSVFLRYANDECDGAYYWRVIAP
jgi:hypothetical protein